MENDKKEVGTNNEIPTTSSEDEKTGIVEQETSKNLTEGLIMTPRQLADAAADILKEAFGTEYNFLKKEGFRVYHIARKDIVVQLTGRPLTPVEGKTVLGEGQMIVTVTPTGKLNIRLNTDTGGIRYMENNLSNDDLIAELPALKKFISDGTQLPPTSKFVSKDDGNGKHTPEDMKERLKNPLK